ncbi:glycosyltransferase family 4 protein [[Clostridium] spiroforme]|nr:glycosyltransferase family 4 protein [Thomasclavelia spiroformis]
MKILFVMHNCDKYSGANLAMQEVIDDLIVKYGVEPIILYPNQKNQSGKDYFNKRGIRCEVAEYWPQLLSRTDKGIKNCIKKLLLLYRHLIMLKSVKKLENVIRNVDLIYTNTSAIKIGLMLASKYNKPHVWHIREFINLDHGLIFPLGEKRYFKTISKLKNKNAVIVISKCLYNSRYEYFGKNKTYLVYDDIATSYINPEKILTDDNINILIAGDIKTGKGQLIAVEAVNILIKKGYRNIHLFIAGKTGDKSYKYSIDKYIKSNRIDFNIHFVGRIDNMNELRKRMEIAIVASTSEAFGRVTVEGMLSKMAVIGRNSGATPEIIQDGLTGVLYDGSSEDLSKKIEKLLDKNYREKLAEQAFSFAIEKYTTKKCCDNVWNVIKSVI